MATNRVLQLTRSNSTSPNFAAAEAAIRALTGKLDGELALARYESSRDNTVDPPVVTYETALGVYFAAQNRWTVFKSSTEIEAALDAIQAELDATQVGAGLEGDGSYEKPLDGEPGFEILGGDDAPDNLKDAIMELADLIAAMDHTKNYTAAVGATPATATDKSKVISGVNQEDGVLDTVTTDAVDLLLTGYANDGDTHTGSIVATDTIETALNKLENATAAGVKISAQAGNQLHRITTPTAEEGLATKLSISKLTSAEIEALTDADKANIRDAYKLVDLDATDSTAKIGDLIKIYKDSALTDVFIGHVDDEFKTPIDAQHKTVTASYTDKATDVKDGVGDEALCFVYHLEDGNYSLQAVNVESFLKESEFADGLQVVNHVVSVKKDTASEQVYTAAGTQADVLTVSSSGVKVANVQNAINYASSVILNTAVTATNERGVNGAQTLTPHISIATTTVDGITRYTITETDIASEDDLDAEITRAKAAEAAIDGAVGLTKGANDETRSYTSQVTLHGSETAPTTVAGDIDLLDSHVEALDDEAVKSVNGSNAININTTSPNDAQNPVVELKLSAQSASTSTDAQYAGGNNTSNILQIKNDGLYLDNVWDCGTF